MSAGSCPRRRTCSACCGAQLAVTIEGMDAFAAGPPARPRPRRRSATANIGPTSASASCIARCAAAFITPLEPEDLFALSRGIDRIINEAKDTVRESEVMAARPTSRSRRWPCCWRPRCASSTTAVATLAPGVAGTTASADRAIKAARRIERVYRSAMGELLRVDDLREVMARRELYRRGSRIGEHVVDVAERVLYAAVKET